VGALQVIRNSPRIGWEEIAISLKHATSRGDSVIEYESLFAPLRWNRGAIAHGRH